MIPFKKKILVTSALPYANGPIHIGHLVEYIQTDIFVRFLRLIGEDVIYCCADDTHGAPIEIKASQLGITPEQLIEKVHREHFADFQRFHIKFDSYYTTNSPENKHFSDHFFLTLQKNGFIYKKTIEQTYCPKCKRVLPDRYVKGTCPKCGAEDQYGDVCEKCNSAYKTVDLIDPYCVICKSTPQRKESEHYFFKLSTFSDKLDAWLTGNKNLQPEIVNFIRNWIKDGLEDWDITRDGPYFGFKIPGEENKYYYVWLDAPIGYIASTENYCKQHGLKAEDYWTGDKAEIIHFIGKDIIYFHFLFWPATLMGIGFNLPKDIIVHGFLTQKEEKMSKSRGSLFTAEDYVRLYNPEHLRFYYAKGLSKKLSDINLDWDDFSDTINNELVANIGNFCYRVLSFIQKNYNGEIKEVAGNEPLQKTFLDGAERVKKLYAEYNFRETVREILALGALGNKYMQDEQPWKKSKEEAAPILGLCANIARNLSILISPILPIFAEKIQEQLGEKHLEWKDIGFGFKGSVRNAEIVMHKFEKKEHAIQEAPHEKSAPIEYDVEDKVSSLGLKFAVAQLTGVNCKKKHEGLEKLKRETEGQVKNFDVTGDGIYLEDKKLYNHKPFEPPYYHLLKLIKEKGKLPNINTIVDSYNPVSVKRLISAGAHDISKIHGKIQFRITTGSEKYIPLGEAGLENVEQGEYACADEKHVLCRLNVKQSEYTKVDEKTKNVMVYVQGNKETSDDVLKDGLNEICENIVKFCGGSYKILEATRNGLFPLNLRVAKIIAADPHPDAEKLVVLQVDLGTEKRQIVAGIKRYYDVDKLPGKNIVIVANLKPAKLRGIESKGMLLAAVSEDQETLALVEAPKSSPGDIVCVDSMKQNESEIKYEEFSKLVMVTKHKKILIDGKPLRTDKEEVSADIADGMRVY